MQPHAQAQDFETRFFDLLESNLSDLRTDMRAGFATVNRGLAENTRETREVKKQAMKTNGRVTKLEAKVFTGPAWWQDKRLAYIALTCLLVFLLIAAAFLRIDIPKVLLP